MLKLVTLDKGYKEVLHTIFTTTLLVWNYFKNQMLEKFFSGIFKFDFEILAQLQALT